MQLAGIICNRKGFTLVELLGVVAIISILATVAIVGIQGSIAAAREGAAMRQVQVLNSAYQTYIAAGGNVLTNAETVDEVIQTLMQPITMAHITMPIGPFVLAEDIADVYTPMIPVAGTKVLTFNAGTGFSLSDLE